MVLLGILATEDVGDEGRANKQGLRVRVFRGRIVVVDVREPVFIQGGIIFFVHFLATIVAFHEGLLNFHRESTL